MLDGIFLSRKILPDRNNMTFEKSIEKSGIFSEISDRNLFTKRMEVNTQILPPRKLIVILVDALRESFVDGDFINYVGDYKGYRMQLFKKLKEKYPKRLKMFTSIADMPTVTNQRIRGMSTGTVPLVFDLGGNAGVSSQIVEDSIIYQAKAMGKTIKMYGDDFWLGLYPTSFDEHEIFPSLDVTNLHDNDNLVRRRVLDQIHNHSDWDILWTHTLGIDHAGHTFNTLGEGMNRKIKDIEQIIEEIIENLPDNTTIALISDHGLTPIGSHGGKSDDEIYTFVAYFQKDVDFPEDRNPSEKLKIISQISTCPNIAVLGGLNFPFSNVGSWIPEIITFSPNSTKHQQLLETLKIFVRNEVQTYIYITKYLEITEISDPGTKAKMEAYLLSIEGRFKTLVFKFKSSSSLYSAEGTPSAEEIDQLEADIYEYIDTGSERILEIKELLIPEWNVSYINTSIAIGALSMLVLVFKVLKRDTEEKDKIKQS
ncbi:unnamed protein product [Moneuplotes crassus]|uniref:GPI ethanolamine phosphate transferase 3 n=1 Tax=Euplotes crassus TaxID=5936 RepID=A0AAD1U9K6_EUPCR|nr:unnamed protein product [Moneuplotes crassus]